MGRNAAAGTGLLYGDHHVTVPDTARPVVLGPVPWTPPETVEAAARAAVARDTFLLVVRAWSDPGIDPGEIDSTVLERWDRLDARLHEEIQRAVAGVRRMLPALRVRPVVVRDDDPAALLADLACGAQLLVLGRPATPHGHRPSPAEALAAAAVCPTLVLPRPPGHETARRADPPVTHPRRPTPRASSRRAGGRDPSRGEPVC